MAVYNGAASTSECSEFLQNTGDAAERYLETPHSGKALCFGQQGLIRAGSVKSVGHLNVGQL
jgi:hypothetical protein